MKTAMMYIETPAVQSEAIDYLEAVIGILRSEAKNWQYVGVGE